VGRLPAQSRAPLERSAKTMITADYLITSLIVVLIPGNFNGGTG
jgi:hypothetical protein